MVGESANLVVYEKVLISNLVVILVTATAVSLLFQRLRLAIIPAYIVAGVISGPSFLGFAKSLPALEEIAHLAVVLLLFGVGMELHLSSLRAELWRMLAASTGAITFTVGLLWLIALQFGLSPIQALCASMALSLSSTAVVLRILSLRRELATSHGQLSLAVLVAQDLAVLGMLAMVPILASWGGYYVPNSGLGSQTLIETLSNAGLKLVGITALVLLAKKLIPTLLREALRDQSGELPLLAGVATALLTAYVSQELGFSLEMGAFIAGFVLASSPFRFHLAGRMSALRDLFMAVFFTTLGMELQLGVVLDNWFIIVMATLALLVTKSTAIAVAAWCSGTSLRLAARVGLALSQAGEFSLILINQASDHGVFNEVYSSSVIAVVMFSLILTPAVFHLAPKIYNLFQPTKFAPWIAVPRKAGQQAEGRECVPTVIIAGFGPLGRHLANKLGHCGVPYTVVELNPATVRTEQANNRPIVFGDITNAQVLESLGVNDAAVLALTVPEPRSSTVATSLARAISSKLLIIARSPTHRDKQALLDAGADKVVVDEDASADEIFSVIASASLQEAEIIE